MINSALSLRYRSGVLSRKSHVLLKVDRVHSRQHHHWEVEISCVLNSAVQVLRAWSHAGKIKVNPRMLRSSYAITEHLDWVFGRFRYILQNSLFRCILKYGLCESERILSLNSLEHVGNRLVILEEIGERMQVLVISIKHILSCIIFKPGSFAIWRVLEQGGEAQILLISGLHDASELICFSQSSFLAARTTGGMRRTRILIQVLVWIRRTCLSWNCVLRFDLLDLLPDNCAALFIERLFKTATYDFIAVRPYLWKFVVFHWFAWAAYPLTRGILNINR